MSLKYLTPILLFVTLFLITSCRKDYLCICTFTTIENNDTTRTVSQDNLSATKDEAEHNCTHGNGTETSGGISFTTDCVLDKIED